MEAEFPQSAREAQEHIRAIRRDKGLGDGPDQIGNNAADLEAALQVLSNDLYQTPTHFLLELIQNADDNSYTAEVPTLSIWYSKGLIRVDCNERGFTRKNVDAICRICQSTKSGRSKSAGFVGEKGIGFKAVFKVAHKVWISSGHYSFRFDRDAHLGMIAPIWDKFPQPTKPGCTSFLLKLAGDCDENGITEELQSHDERTLLFLRRLRRLEIDVKPGILSLKKPYRTILGRQGGSSDTASTMVLMRDGVKKHYFVYRQEAAKLPREARRPGISSSEIVLAFPHTGINGDRPVRPVIESQNVYAFLPIRNAGFHFLLQADFLLSANREDVHLDPAWNKVLSITAAVAFCNAVLHVGTLSNNLRYSWVEYIPTTIAKTPFFENLRQGILTQLKKSKILEAQSGNRWKPADLVRVPDMFLDSTGRPFMMRDKDGDKYLAGRYDKPGAAERGLDALSLKIMDVTTFYREMELALKGGPAEFFASKSTEWHSSFARALRCTNRPFGAPELPVIPLKDGTWVNRGQGNFFPDSTSAVPQGINVSLVDAEAAANPSRKELFAVMGVEDLTGPRIKDLIRNTHANIVFNPDHLDPEVLVSHAAFLFGERDKTCLNRPMSIWMAAEVGPCRRSDTMYLPSGVSSAASRLLPHSAGATYGFLHPEYLKVDVPDKALWLEFLQNHCQVRVYPRFFVPKYNLKGSAEINLHGDFRFVMENLAPNTWLSVLRDGWSFYETWLGGVSRDRDVSNYRSELQALVKYLCEYKVLRTGGGGLATLKDTYMPRKYLTEEYGNLAPFLDVPDPTDYRWGPLMMCFGIGEEADVKFYLSCLGGAKKDWKVSVDKIKHIMHKIEDGLDVKTDELNLIRTRMNQEKLIHVPPAGKGREGDRGIWVSQLHCFWRGEQWLTQSFGLEKVYPDLEVLFRTYLLVPNAGADHYISEARALTKLERTPLSQIERVFVALTSQVKAGGLDTRQKDEIRSLDIIPVTSPGDAFRNLVAVSAETPWLIADRENLRDQFRSVLPLCMFEPAFVLKIKPLLVAIGLGDRILSELVTSITEAEGEAEFHKDLTKKYRKRSKYLFRLIPENQADPEHLRSKFSYVNVFVAPKIVQYWNAPLGLSQVTSTRSEGIAFLESDLSGVMRIYLRAGYEEDAYPYELAEQLRAFFNISPGHRDLLAAAITAPEERVEQLFDSRGIAPLIEEGVSRDGEDVTLGPVRFPPGPSKTARMRLGGESRLTRLLSSTRFGPSFFNTVEATSGTLPPYDVAVQRSTHNAIGRPVEPRSFLDGVTLAGLNNELGKLEFVQKEGAVVGTPRVETSFFDRFRSWAHRDSDAGEAMVSDILAVILGRQYYKEQMWQTRRQRRQFSTAAFTFADTQGKFSSFLMRLDGLPGKAQGYTRLVYHLDVKASDSGYFELTQNELARARSFSVHSQPNPAQKAPSKNVAVLVHISDLRSEPRIRFLADPWDLFQDGQLELESTTTYRASLRLRERRRGGKEAGFDVIQIRERGGEEEEVMVPAYEDGEATGTRKEKVKGKKWKGKGRAVNV